MTKPQQRRTSRWYPRILASDTTISTSTKETYSVQADRPSTDFNTTANTSKQDVSTTRSGSPGGPSCSAPDEPAPVVGVEPPSGSDRALSTASDTQSSWWGWGRPVNLETRASASSTRSAHESTDASLVDASSLQTQEIQTTPSLNDSNPQTYVARVGSWVYSWYDNGVPVSSLSPNDSAPNSSQPGSTNQLSDLIPNPISESIPTNSRGWAGMFSTRRVIPARDVDEERKSVETMEIELTSSSPEDLGPTQQSTRKSEPEAQSEPPKAEIHQPLTDSSLPLSRISIVNGKARATIPNLVLPSFEDTFMHPPRSFAPKSATNNKLKQTIDLVQAYIFSSPPISPEVELEDLHTRERQIRELFHRNSHISVRLPKPLEVLGVDKKERLKALGKVVVIGIHGWFPGPWLETVIGKPTGTSAKFANMMGSSLQEYVEGHLGGSLNQEFLTLIALEGDGTVDKRVDRLYKELYKRQDWVHSIHAADAIFVVAHSQGSIVSCKLLERLIKMDGVSGEKVMLLCMCGIWNGPFMGLNNSYAFQPVLKLLEGPAAHELFEFQDPRSRASQSVLASLNFCLSTGIKMLLVASLNDQVVPLYSALYNSISHPSILRAVFIDSAVFYSTDFLTNLITFCQRLRNAGLSDHGLQNHLSEAVIGSLSGVGHSTVYEDRDVFNLAVRYFFETSSPLESPTWVEEPARKGRARRKRLPLSLTQVDSSFFPKERQNPFLLPWALRGLMDDRLVQMLFGRELKRLRAEFDDWKPVTKVLKELKMRLEPLKSVKDVFNPFLEKR
ncbi:hypothetical protein CROQUDRAFT_38547 [Cronartium quercuum f. sp. fusiforme G11]|uniref:YMC020W-like alpha/beta hydrolase domain-containing protein n=1 Tax=Cronartium quercuum f. sp. fusiforme G11 TaxID=708437 RepID=A0A9P6NQW6_9BASI|nr:hypothetical protein CROQUDRAFT_38547 [Cronartium quercuum f. sp. fusiforme G11]